MGRADELRKELGSVTKKEIVNAVSESIRHHGYYVMSENNFISLVCFSSAQLTKADMSQALRWLAEEGFIIKHKRNERGETYYIIKV